MTSTIQDPLVLPALADFTAQRPVLSSSYTQLPRVQNRLFSDLGVEIAGRTATGSSPLFTTTSGTYPQDDASGGDAVETWHGVSQGWRLLESSKPLRFELRTFCQDLATELTLVQLDNGTLIGSITDTGSSALEWRTLEYAVDLANAFSGSTPRPIAAFVRFTHTGDGSKGDLYAFSLRERILRAADTSLLPTS